MVHYNPILGLFFSYVNYLTYLWFVQRLLCISYSPVSWTHHLLLLTLWTRQVVRMTFLRVFCYRFYHLLFFLLTILKYQAHFSHDNISSLISPRRIYDIQLFWIVLVGHWITIPYLLKLKCFLCFNLFYSMCALILLGMLYSSVSKIICLI